MESTKFLKKHLQCYEESNNYCSGKYVGSVNNLVESYIAVTNAVFRQCSAHRRGKSKRLKQDTIRSKSFWFRHEKGCVPIPFCGYVFEIISTESWKCSVEIDKQSSQLLKSGSKRSHPINTKCPAIIQVRTIKLFTDYIARRDEKSAGCRKEQENVKSALLEKLQSGEEPNYKIVAYCRFPLESAHGCDKAKDISLNRMDRRVAKKIRELASNGIHDVECIQSMLSDYVKNTMFAQLDDHELPSVENSRYYPTKRVIHKHLVAAIGPMKHLHLNTLRSVQPPPVVMNILESRKETPQCRPESTGVGLIAVHGGAGYHSDERWPGYQRLCDEACWMAMTCLKQGGTAGEAVTLAVKVLEDSELTNAGFGSNLTEDGNVECDASVMDGSITTGSRAAFGAVTGVSSVRNPVCAAYQLAAQQIARPTLSLGRVPPCVMSGEGAAKWAAAHRVETCDPTELKSESSHKTWQKYHRKLFEKLTSKSTNDATDASERLDTVGAIAIDIYGNVASAASSGGLLMKLPGRVGQAAMFGCGCWAEDGEGSKPSVAVTTSGCGEQLMYTTAAVKCARNLQSTDEPYVALQQTLLQDILNSPLLEREDAKQAGLLALHQTKDDSHSTTELVWGHTTKSFLIGYMSTKDHKPEVLISRLPDGATPGKSLSVSGTWVKVAMEASDSSPVEIFEEKEGSSGPSIPPCEGSSIPPCSPPNNEHSSPILSNAQFDGTDDNNLSIDDDITLMYVSTDVDGLTVKDCAVTLSDDFNRKIDDEFETKIDTRWHERLKNNPRLFNASKFRIDSVEEVGEILQFRLGLTCYKDYMETNWSTEVEKLREKGERVHGNAQVYLAEPLGVAGVIVTSDDQVVFHRRNHWVAESAGMMDVPGGHPEPTAAAKLDDTTTVELRHLQPDDVIEEVFTSQLKEVHDEVNIPFESLSEPRLMGLMRNKKSGGRPVCYFLIRCSLSSTAIEELYREGGAETDESTQLVFKQEKEMMYLERECPAFWSELCPNGKAAVTLYSILGQVKKGRNPFQMK